MELRVDSNVSIRAVEPDLPNCVRWSSMEPLNPVLQTLLGAIKALMGVAEPLIGAQQRDLTMAIR